MIHNIFYASHCFSSYNLSIPVEPQWKMIAGYVWSVWSLVPKMRPCGLQPIKMLHCRLILKPHSSRLSRQTAQPQVELSLHNQQIIKFSSHFIYILYQPIFILRSICNFSYSVSMFELQMTVYMSRIDDICFENCVPFYEWEFFFNMTNHHHIMNLPWVCFVVHNQSKVKRNWRKQPTTCQRFGESQVKMYI